MCHLGLLLSDVTLFHWILFVLHFHRVIWYMVMYGLKTMSEPQATVATTHTKNDFKECRFDFKLNKGKTLSSPTHSRHNRNCHRANWWASYSKRNLTSDRWKQHMKALIYWMVINFRLILFWACCVQTCSVEEKACWAKKTSSSPSCA